jgi:transcriptional regulator with XRE-family HTH domain
MSSVFATWLSGAMNAQGYDPRRLARALSVSEGTVHNWLHQGAMPNLHNIVELSRVFNVGTETLVQLAGYDVVVSGSPDERERRRAELLAKLPRFAEIAEKVAKLPPVKQDAYLSIIEKMVPEDEG